MPKTIRKKFVEKQPVRAPRASLHGFMEELAAQRAAGGTTTCMKLLAADLAASRAAATDDNKVDLMISRANSNYYDDFCSPLAMPCHELIADLNEIGLQKLAEAARDGKYDA